MSNVDLPNRARHVTELYHAAANFCRVIEHWQDADPRIWLRNAATCTLALKKSVEIIVPGAVITVDDVGECQRFEFYSAMKQWLGDLDNYWMAGDRATDSPELSGSLADDFSDIYFELLPGLQFGGDEERAIVAGHWRSQYDMHWGEHCADSLRYLSILQMCQKI